jgi:hypothetical protein
MGCTNRNWRPFFHQYQFSCLHKYLAISSRKCSYFILNYQEIRPHLLYCLSTKQGEEKRLSAKQCICTIACVKPHLGRDRNLQLQHEQNVLGRWSWQTPGMRFHFVGRPHRCTSITSPTYQNHQRRMTYIAAPDRADWSIHQLGSATSITSILCDANRASIWHHYTRVEGTGAVGRTLTVEWMCLVWSLFSLCGRREPPRAHRRIVPRVTLVDWICQRSALWAAGFSRLNGRDNPSMDFSSFFSAAAAPPWAVHHVASRIMIVAEKTGDVVYSCFFFRLRG